MWGQARDAYALHSLSRIWDSLSLQRHISEPKIIPYKLYVTAQAACLFPGPNFGVFCSQFEVLDVAWDATLGSEALDMLLLDHFAEEFKQLHAGLDPRDSPKVGCWGKLDMV